MSIVEHKQGIIIWVTVIAISCVAGHTIWDDMAMIHNPMTYTKQGVITEIDTSGSNPILHFADGTELTVIGWCGDIPLGKEVVINYKKNGVGEAYLLEIKVYE
jgi:hypothetical protein